MFFKSILLPQSRTTQRKKEKEKEIRIKVFILFLNKVILRRLYEEKETKTIKDLSFHFILKRNNIDIGSGDKFDNSESVWRSD